MGQMFNSEYLGGIGKANFKNVRNAGFYSILLPAFLTRIKAFALWLQTKIKW